MATNQSNSAFVAFARLFWMFAGPAGLFLLAYSIARQNEGWFAPTGIAFLIVLFGVIFARRLDPNNAFGDPATPAEIQVFTLGAIFVGLGGWIIVNLM